MDFNTYAIFFLDELNGQLQVIALSQENSITLLACVSFSGFFLASIS